MRVQVSALPSSSLGTARRLAAATHPLHKCAGSTWLPSHSLLPAQGTRHQLILRWGGRGEERYLWVQMVNVSKVLCLLKLALTDQSRHSAGQTNTLHYIWPALSSPSIPLLWRAVLQGTHTHTAGSTELEWRQLVQWTESYPPGVSPRGLRLQHVHCLLHAHTHVILTRHDKAQCIYRYNV